MTFNRNIHSKPALMNVAIYFRSAVWKCQKLNSSVLLKKSINVLLSAPDILT